MTQADLDALRNVYFILEDGSDWPSGTPSASLAQGYKARIATLSQKTQDDLVALMDALDAFVA